MFLTLTYISIFNPLLNPSGFEWMPLRQALPSYCEIDAEFVKKTDDRLIISRMHPYLGDPDCLNAATGLKLRIRK
jgi:hypothetical protein